MRALVWHAHTDGDMCLKIITAGVCGLCSEV